MCDMSEIKYTKHLYRLHMLYMAVICVLIMIVTLCIMPIYVTDEAFKNFSFASTVVSIVLAVVSIVYSLWSGQKSNNQYTGMSNIERKIDEQLQGFSHIEQSLSEKLKPINSRFDQLTEDQTKTRSIIQELKSLIGDNHNTVYSQNKSKYNLEDYPTYANLALYTICLSKTKEKEIPQSMLEKIIGNYWIGFMVAFSRIYPDKLKYKPQKESVIITIYDTNFFPSQNVIASKLKKDIASFDTLFNEIEQYFGVKSSICE